jgi:hypothetical protein
MLIFYFTLFEYIAKDHFLKKNAILQFSYIREIKVTATTTKKEEKKKYN